LGTAGFGVLKYFKKQSEPVWKKNGSFKKTSVGLAPALVLFELQSAA
jgi:hypothetical protein